ncbi:hypothetical protein ACWDWO_22545 [Actinopolymorpha singaporensis]|uniref:Uncharacterized protein n=1 Tax=Actinopolymorpha singaporensis TaxID=117157 RepID=A0A1H1SE85_9ACTN|nr:hypothetical protein [Actinopolymorpha singaporensis]SDS46400.1 hypothetical protein SAMN04489717_2774 [Actinopolymorpha singaporensis]
MPLTQLGHACVRLTDGATLVVDPGAWSGFECRPLGGTFTRPEPGGQVDL